jgi:hypothetical protein
MSAISCLWTPTVSGISTLGGSQHENQLANWVTEQIEFFERGELASGALLVAYLGNRLLDNKNSFDWQGAIEEHLVQDEKAMSYSAAFGRKLYRFDDQWQQFNINAAYNCWFIYKNEGLDGKKFVDQISSQRQPGGLYFDGITSPTIYRHRMKTEIAMSTAMAIDVLNQEDLLTASNRSETLAALLSPTTMPILNYLSYEYFRSRAVDVLDPSMLDKSRIETLLLKCAEELPFGWADFVMSEKTNDYMGTATRVARDRNIDSPILATMAYWLASKSTTPIMSEAKRRLAEYAKQLASPHKDIPAFKMRDLQFDFGSSITGLELIAATNLTNT